MKSLPANPRLGSSNPFPAAKKKAWNFNSSRLFVVRSKNRFFLRFPAGMNFWAGLDGQVYVRGNIYATDGVFNGIVKATDFQLPSGDSMVSILNNDKKIKSDWLDLMGINVKDENGNTVMTIDGTNGITIQKGTIKWGSISGKPSIPSLPGYIQSTYIDATKVESFHIKGNRVEVVIPYGSGSETGFVLTGPVGSKLQYGYMRIYADEDSNYTVFTSPSLTRAYWMFPGTEFTGDINFSGASVRGLHLTLA